MAVSRVEIHQGWNSAIFYPSIGNFAIKNSTKKGKHGNLNLRNKYSGDLISENQTIQNFCLNGLWQNGYHVSVFSLVGLLDFRSHWKYRPFANWLLFKHSKTRFQIPTVVRWWPFKCWAKSTWLSNQDRHHYSWGLNTEHWNNETQWNTKHFEVLFFNGPKKMATILFRFPMVRTIGKLNFWLVWTIL